MRIEAVQLEHVGPFARRVSVGPLARGLNILAAANEFGKSTLVKAVARALFDRHTCKDGEIKTLQPVGTDLSPRVTASISIGAARFKIDKTFLNSPRSVLSEWRLEGWQPVAEGDQADLRLQQMLKSRTPGRGATTAAHWGLMNFLWARQGDPAAWPEWEGESGSLVQTRLVKVELDRAMEQLQGRLSERYLESFTPTGQVKTAGPLKKAEDELGALDAELAEIRRKRIELETLQAEYTLAGSRLEALERESVEKQKQAEETRQMAADAEALGNQLNQRRTELEAAQAALHRVAEDAAAMAACHEALVENQAKAAKTKESLALLAGEMEALEARRRGLEAEVEQQQARGYKMAAELDQARLLLKSRRTRLDFEQLDATAKKIAGLRSEQAKWREQLALLPDISAASLKKLVELERGIREKRIQMDALGVRVELRPDHDAKVAWEGDGGAGRTVIRGQDQDARTFPQSVKLELEGWGTISIRSGAAEAKDLANALKADEARLTRMLGECEAPSVEKAQQAAERRAALAKEIETAEARAGEWLGEWRSWDELEAELAARRTRAEQAAGRIDGADHPASLAEIEAREQDLETRVRHEERRLKTLEGEWKEVCAKQGALAAKGAQLDKELSALAGKKEGLDAQMNLLQGRYEGGIDAAKRAAQKAFFEAETRRDALQAKLPPGFERLPERNRRAAAAAGQVQAELQQLRTSLTRLDEKLKTLGGDGLFSRENRLLEKREMVVATIERLRSRAWMARLARDLIEFRKQAATRQVLAPLESRLSATFSEITGNAERKVFLDESLGIRGVGRSPEELVSFDCLSQGAREQLLLALRLAIAMELSAEEAHMLILDDVLVNTDPNRQERILDIIATVSETVQILILTCHPDRYRGVGQSVRIMSVD